MTRDERALLRRALRTLEATGGAVLLPLPPRNGKGQWFSDVETAVRWIAKHIPPTKQTQELIRREQARLAEVAAAERDPELLAMRRKAKAVLRIWQEEQAFQNIASARLTLPLNRPAAEEATP